MTFKDPSEDPLSHISLIRKILIAIFVVGFWLFFYRYMNPKPPEHPQKQTQPPAQNREILPREK